jgi:hypothetical protein
MSDAIRYRDIVIPKPCEVPWEQMEVASGGNRFCQQCQTVVHDFSKMTEREIIALIQRSGGTACGSFRMDVNGEPIVLSPKPSKPVFLRNIAATASLLLLQQTAAQAHQLLAPTAVESVLLSGNPGKGKNEPKTNTLVTCVVTNGQDEEIPDDIEVRIFKGEEMLMKVKTRNGLLSLDLAGKVLPEEQISIMIWGDNSRPQYSFKGKTINTLLGDAQNLKVRLVYTYSEYYLHNLPPRRGGGGMHINLESL